MEMVGAGNEMDMHATLLPQKSTMGFPASVGFVVFLVLWIVPSSLIALHVSSASSHVTLLIGFAIGAAGGITAFRRVAKWQRSVHAREAQEAQTARSAEVEKQIAEMKRKAAKAEGTE